MLSGAVHERYSCGVFVVADSIPGSTATPPAGTSEVYFAALGPDGGVAVGTWGFVQLSSSVANVQAGLFDNNHVESEFFAGAIPWRPDGGPSWTVEIDPGLNEPNLVQQGVFALQITSAGNTDAFDGGYSKVYLHAQGTLAAELLPAPGTSTTEKVDVCIQFTDSRPTRDGLQQPGPADAG